MSEDQKATNSTTGRCVSCRHWKREWWPSKEWEFGPETGGCDAFGSRKHSPEGDELKRLAFPLQPSEGIMGRLITRPEFGCVVWEGNQHDR
jgi:hypothetical protein